MSDAVVAPWPRSVTGQQTMCFCAVRVCLWVAVCCVAHVACCLLFAFCHGGSCLLVLFSLLFVRYLVRRGWKRVDDAVADGWAVADG